LTALDRESGVPLVDQLVHQLRFLIASGRYQVGESLPSTRVLASRLDVSFHTVRKAYNKLAEAGLVAAKSGRGFLVVAAVAGKTSERLESGAIIASDAIQRLMGLGLGEHEIEAVLLEQLEQLQDASSVPDILFAAPYVELAKRCSELIEVAINLPVDPILLRDLGAHPDAEYVITPFASLSQVIRAAPDAHAVGVTVFYAHELQEALARLTAHDAVGIAVLDSTSVEPIMIDIRGQTGFSGQVFGVSAHADRAEFSSILEQVDLLLYTHQSRRRVQPKLAGHPSVKLDPRITLESLEVVRKIFSSR